MSTQIAALFTPGINKFGGLKFRLYQPEYKKLFRIVPMSGRQWLYQEFQRYGFPGTTLPLSPVHMDEIRQSFSKALNPITRTLGDIAAKEDWDDDPYGMLRRVLPASAGAMADSHQQKREYDCFYAFLSVSAYSTASPVTGSPDGKPLFSATCPISLYNNADTFSNRASNPVALSSTAYYSAYTYFRTTKDPNNAFFIQGAPKYLLHNPSQRAIALQLANSDYERGSSTQAFTGLQNAAKLDNLQLIENPYFQKTLSGSAAGTNDGWQLFGDDHGLIFGDRSGFESMSDFDANLRGYFWVSEGRYDLGFIHHRNSYSGA